MDPLLRTSAPAATGPAPAAAATATHPSAATAALFRQQLQTALLRATTIDLSADDDSDGTSSDDPFASITAGLPTAATGATSTTGAGANLFGMDLSGLGVAGQSVLANGLSSYQASGLGSTTLDGATAGSSADAAANAQVVAEQARATGADPVTAVAMMLVESGGNARAVGDGGSSFGLFQLHQGGMLTAAGLSAQQAFDPATNARVALTSLAAETRKGPGRSPGQIAAASQRPADQAAYAAAVDGKLAQAAALLGRSARPVA